MTFLFLFPDNQEENTADLNNEADESALLESDEPLDEGQPAGEGLEEKSAGEGDAAKTGETDGNDAVVEENMDTGAGEDEEKEEEEEEEEEIKLSDNEMPQVNVATLGSKLNDLFCLLLMDNSIEDCLQLLFSLLFSSLFCSVKPNQIRLLQWTVSKTVCLFPVTRSCCFSSS